MLFRLNIQISNGPAITSIVIEAPNADILNDTEVDERLMEIISCLIPSSVRYSIGEPVTTPRPTDTIIRWEFLHDPERYT